MFWTEHASFFQFEAMFASLVTVLFDNERYRELVSEVHTFIPAEKGSVTFLTFTSLTAQGFSIGVGPHCLQSATRPHVRLIIATRDY